MPDEPWLLEAKCLGTLDREAQAHHPARMGGQIQGGRLPALAKVKPPGVAINLEHQAPHPCLTPGRGPKAELKGRSLPGDLELCANGFAS